MKDNEEDKLQANNETRIPSQTKKTRLTLHLHEVPSRALSSKDGCSNFWLPVKSKNDSGNAVSKVGARHPHPPSHNPSCSPEFERVWESSMTGLSDRFAQFIRTLSRIRQSRNSLSLVLTFPRPTPGPSWGQLLYSKLDGALRRLSPLGPL